MTLVFAVHNVRRMGRPKIPGDAPIITIKVQRDLLARIDEVMNGSNRRAAFIRSAIQHELERIERLQRKADRDALREGAQEE